MTDATMTMEPVSVGDEAQDDGIYVLGTFLGVERSRTWRPRDSDKDVELKPRIGIAVNGEEIGVQCKDDAQLDAVTRGLSHGDPVRIRVEVRPPFGARGAVSYSLPGVVVTRTRWT